MSDELISLGQALKLFPWPAGWRPSEPTLYRWCRIGVYGRKLRTVHIGGRRLTTLAALKAFVREVNGGDDPSVIASNPAPSTPPLAGAAAR